MMVASLGLLALMVSGPFLWPFHSDPLPGFWSEWWAAALGLAAVAAGLGATRGRAVMLPAVLMLPVVLLLALLLQFGLQRLAFPQIGLLYAAYLLWAGMLMILGRHLAATVGLVRLADVLAGAVALGALIGAAIALAQWLGVGAGREWIFPKLGGSIYGNLGQSNHHAHYSWLGIASAFYLRGRGLLSRPLLWTVISLVACGSVLSGSRSVFVYPLVLVAVLGWSRLRQANGAAASLLADAVLLVPMVIGLSMLGTWATPHLAELAPRLGLELTGGPAPITAGSRLYEIASGPSTRLEIARSAWSAFLEQPWLGQGAGNYSWASFGAAAAHVGAERYAVTEHAHNLVLQLLAEFGAPVTAMVLVVLGIWLKGFFRKPWGLEQSWCAAVLAIGAVHALLEYPLWYAYFLGPTALLLGAADSRPIMALSARRAAVYLCLVAVTGVFILTGLRKDYTTLEVAVYAPLAAHPEREQAWRITMERLLKLHQESLLSPWALLGFATLAEPSRQQAQHRATLCEKGIRFSPARWLLLRCAMQLAIAGRERDAQELALQVLRAFPALRDTSIDELSKAAQKHPEIASLRDLSLLDLNRGPGSPRPPG